MEQFQLKTCTLFSTNKFRLTNPLVAGKEFDYFAYWTSPDKMFLKFFQKGQQFR